MLYVWIMKLSKTSVLSVLQIATTERLMKLLLWSLDAISMVLVSLIVAWVYLFLRHLFYIVKFYMRLTILAS
ncbi:unnamed protein product [Blepharisma stoltei]|uniref:Uncharacterized protein n=1 Tax=Blepharisma stoltei TaxID=1481888 RepID=A0AAU9JLB3_9CILI|nr:unnamed protein product [Blepharisma stoltei]